MKIKLTSKALLALLEAEPVEFPKYTTQIINLANQNAQGTRPRVVGQLSELITEFSGRTLKEWEVWYLARYPNAIKQATDRIYAMVEQFRIAINQIDKQMVEAWVRDLVIVKTFIGLRFQEAILKEVAEQKGETYRFSTPEEESRGIDGYIGTLPVSIKPDTYKAMRQLPESIEVGFIFYKKRKDGMMLEYDF